MGQGCVFVSMCLCVSSNGKISRWFVYITLSVEILCWPLGWGKAFRPEVLKVKKVHGTVQIAARLHSEIPTFIL